MYLRRCVFLLVMVCFSQVVSATDPLPDETFICKKLENGLTYYIKNNHFPKNKASLRLVVNAGSIHEQEHQRGLAHFLEHMLFRGSEHFSDGEIIKFLESIGAKFGPDTNAYTSFTQTVYQLEIPLDREGVLETGVLICSDWAGRATISNELVEKERGVVTDEYNLNMKQCSTRQFKKIFGKFLGKSVYNERWPIGLKEVIQNCDPQSIRDFYKKWYTPDRMAFIVVGDIDEHLVEEAIIRNFSTLAARTEAVEEPDTSLHLSEESIFEVFYDEEQMLNMGYLLSFLDLHQEADEPNVLTRESVKDALYRGIFQQVLHQRLSRQLTTNPAPYVAHYPMNIDISRIGIRGIGFVPFEDRPYEGVKIILREIVRLLTFGPCDTEFNGEIASLTASIKDAVANVHRMEHAEYVEEFIHHFTKRSVVYDHKERLLYKLSVLEEISRKEMLEWLGEKGFEPFRHILYEVSKQNLVEVNQIENAVEEWMKEEVVDCQKVVDKPFALTTKHSTANNQLLSLHNDKMNARTLILDNQMKIILQPTELEKHQVCMQMVAKKGKNALSTELLAAAEIMALDYTMNCGLGNLNGEELQRFLSANNIQFTQGVTLNQRTLSLASTSENLETLFDLAMGYFSERRRDHAIFNCIAERHIEAYKNLENNPYVYFAAHVAKEYRNNHPLYVNHNPSEITEEACAQVVDQLFSDPSEFCMILVGDFVMEEVEKMIQEYFFPKLKKNHLSIIQPVNIFPESSGDVIVEKGKESHSLTFMVHGGSFSYPEIDFRMTALAFDEIFSARLLNKIRKEMGETYSVYCTTYFPNESDQSELCMLINFASEPEAVASIKETIHQEMEKILVNGIEHEEVERAKALLNEHERVSFLSNSGFLQAHCTAHLFDLDVANLIDFKSRIHKQVTQECLERYIQKLFSAERHLVSYTLNCAKSI